MGDNDSKSMTVDIPDDAVQEALQSVENIEKQRSDKSDDESGETEIAVEIVSENQPAGDRAAEKEPGESKGPSREHLLATCEELRKKVKDTRDRMLRIAADADNTRKRALKERKEIEKFGQEKLFRDILPVLDNLERTLDHVPDDAEDPVVISLREGLEMTLRQFQDTLSKHHLNGFSAAGEKFDPNLHEALNRTPTDEVEPGMVVSEMQRGYKLHDRLLRPALVSVACKPEEGAQPEEPKEEESAPSGPNGEE